MQPESLRFYKYVGDNSRCSVLAKQPPGFSRWHSDKESTCQRRRGRRQGFDPWVRKIPWRRKWQSTPVFLPGKSHGQRSLTATVHVVARVRHNLETKPPPPQTVSQSDLSPWHLAISLSLLAGTGVQIWCLAKFLENLKVWLHLQVNQLPSRDSRFYNQSENLELRF